MQDRQLLLKRMPASRLEKAPSRMPYARGAEAKPCSGGERMRGCTQLHHTSTHTHTHARVRAHPIHMHTHIHIHIHIHIHTHTLTHSLTHSHTYTHTHTHTHSARPLSRTAIFANEQRKLERRRFQAVRAAVRRGTVRESANRRTGEITKIHANHFRRAKLS